MTGDDVTECVGGEVSGITDDDLSKNYKSHCDPRLNGQQALEIAFLIAARMRRSEGLPPLDFDDWAECDPLDSQCTPNNMPLP